MPLNLNDPRIFAGYDPRSVERGIRYAAEGRVELIDMGDDWASGDVAGTRSTPSNVRISCMLELTIPIPLAQSIGLPPPTATIPLHSSE